MISGRASAVLAGVFVLLASVLVPATGSAAPIARAAKKKPVLFRKARVRSDGFVTPGELESVSFSRLPPKANLKVAIEPPPTTPQCGQFYFCEVVRVFPAVGTPPFRTDRKGRSLATFVMPSSYVIESDPFDPSTRQSVTFMNGQSVHVNVLGVKKLRKRKLIGFGFGRTIVQIPQS